MCKWCKWVLVWGWVLIRCWLFHCGFVDGCFIADEYFFVGECFFEGDSEGWRSGWIGLIGWGGWLGIGRRCSYARVYARSRPTSFVFCCHKCHSGWSWKYFIIPKTTYRFTENHVSFCWKQRIVLLKTSCRFMENNVLFCGKWRVVLNLRSKSCFEDGVLGSFWGGVAVWKCDIFLMLFLLSV